jgi:hypothetical protein
MVLKLRPMIGYYDFRTRRQFPPASFTTKTGRHDIAEILLKVALNTNKQTNHCFCIVYKGHNSYKCGLTILESNQIRCIWSIDPQLYRVHLAMSEIPYSQHQW